MKQFFVLIKVTFVDLFIIKIYALSTYSYTLLQKNVKIFYNNLGYHVD